MGTHPEFIGEGIYLILVTVLRPYTRRRERRSSALGPCSATSPQPSIEEPKRGVAPSTRTTRP